MRSTSFYTIWFLLIVALCVPNFASSQVGETAPNKKFFIELSAGFLQHGQLKSPVLHTFCFEGCNPIEQSGAGSSYFAVSGAWEFLPKLALRLGFISHTRRIEETLQSNFGGGTFTNEVMQEYYGLQPSIQYEIITWKSLSLYTDNGLALEWARDASRRDVDLAVSFTNQIGLRFRPKGGHWAITIHSLTFLPLDTYYKEDVFTDFEDYLPYALGGAASVQYRF